MVSGGDVTDGLFSPDSSVVVYRADQDTDDLLELYGVATGEPSDFLFANGFE